MFSRYTPVGHSRFTLPPFPSPWVLWNLTWVDHIIRTLSWVWPLGGTSRGPQGVQCLGLWVAHASSWKVSDPTHQTSLSPVSKIQPILLPFQSRGTNGANDY